MPERVRQACAKRRKGGRGNTSFFRGIRDAAPGTEAVPPATTPGTGRTIWATADRRLMRFTSDAPSKVDVSQVAGLAQGEQIVGVAFRKKNGLLYAVGSTSRLYALAQSAAIASPVSFIPFAATLEGTAFGLDFDPVSDLGRVTSNTAANIRLEVNTGTVTNVDGRVAYVPGDENAGAVPRASAVAYAADGKGYAIDTKTGTLARIVDAFSGRIQPIGGMGTAFTDVAGFDLVTGKITVIGKIGDGGPVTGIAIAIAP